MNRKSFINSLDLFSLFSITMFINISSAIIFLEKIGIFSKKEEIDMISSFLEKSQSFQILIIFIGIISLIIWINYLVEKTKLERYLRYLVGDTTNQIDKIYMLSGMKILLLSDIIVAFLLFFSLNISAHHLINIFLIENVSYLLIFFLVWRFFTFKKS